MSSSEMRDRVAALVEEAKVTVASTHQAAMVARELRKLPGTEVIDPVHMRNHEYDIRFSMFEYLQHHVATLKQLAPLQLAAVPEVVDLWSISDTQHDGVLILRYSACPGERLVCVEDTDEPFRPEAAARFRAEMQKLGAAGYVHPYAVEDLYYWLMSSETGTIVLDEWSVAKAATPASTKNMLKAVDDWLASRS